MNTHAIRTALLLLASVYGSSLLSCGFLAGKLPSFTGAESGIKDLRLPPGFRAELYADDVKGARSMALARSGILFVGTRDEGNVYALVPVQGKKPRVVRIAQELNDPNGVALRNGALYVAEIHRLIRFDAIESSIDKHPGPTVVSTRFPDDEWHGWKFIRFGPDGKLYIPVGMPCNTCEPKDERFGTIMRCNPDGSDLEIYAKGIRNTVGFDWDPRSKELWFTDNGRDWAGDDLPPDELNHAPKAGMHFGFPYCYGRNVADPDYERHDCSRYTPSAVDLGPHVAALGMRFYTGTMFPEKYRHGIFIAEHGSWNRSTPIGYRIMFVRMEGGTPMSYEVFAEGWLKGGTAWGRPVDVEMMPDGSLLVSDDKADAVYRIVYESPGDRKKGPEISE